MSLERMDDAIAFAKMRREGVLPDAIAKQHMSERLELLSTLVQECTHTVFQRQEQVESTIGTIFEEVEKSLCLDEGRKTVVELEKTLHDLRLKTVEIESKLEKTELFYLAKKEQTAQLRETLGGLERAISTQRSNKQLDKDLRSMGSAMSRAIYDANRA